MAAPKDEAVEDNTLANIEVLRYKGHMGREAGNQSISEKEARVAEKSESREAAEKKREKQGTVRSFDTGRGSGEIEADSGELVQVFRSALRDEALSGLYPGDIVSFKIGRDRFGRTVAQEVRRIGWDEGEDPDAPPREWTF